MAVRKFWESMNSKPGNGAYSKVSMVVGASKPREAVDGAESFGKEGTRPITFRAEDDSTAERDEWNHTTAPQESTGRTRLRSLRSLRSVQVHSSTFRQSFASGAGWFCSDGGRWVQARRMFFLSFFLSSFLSLPRISSSALQTPILFVRRLTYSRQ